MFNREQHKTCSLFLKSNKLYMKNIRIINTTTGSEVQGYWETEEQAWEFIEEQSNPLEYKIMED